MIATQYVGMDIIVAAVVELLGGPGFTEWMRKVWADRGDGLLLPGESFERIYDHEVDPETVGEKFFAIVTGGRTDRDFPFGAPFGTNDTTTDDTSSRVQVGVIVFGGSDDAGVMTKQAQRTIVAVRECIRQYLYAPWIGGSASVRFGPEDYLPVALIPGEQNILMKGATIDVIVPSIQ